MKELNRHLLLQLCEIIYKEYEIYIVLPSPVKSCYKNKIVPGHSEQEELIIVPADLHIQYDFR